eukprot:TRINITY_DN18300_c0_g1_i1.p3 TRINITY_DN18300_c0_g1~~TRINITY_DN18300_c0_g1_i1.p3  ORF type:complete len:124 (+),score=9.88 TRINITY_DN18300_c0_g1_i1:125-496(+)
MFDSLRRCATKVVTLRFLHDRVMAGGGRSFLAAWKFLRRLSAAKVPSHIASILGGQLGQALQLPVRKYHAPQPCSIPPGPGVDPECAERKFIKCQWEGRGCGELCQSSAQRFQLFVLGLKLGA